MVLRLWLKWVGESEDQIIIMEPFFRYYRTEWKWRQFHGASAAENDTFEDDADDVTSVSDDQDHEEQVLTMTGWWRFAQRWNRRGNIGVRRSRSFCPASAWRWKMSQACCSLTSKIEIGNVRKRKCSAWKKSCGRSWPIRMFPKPLKEGSGGRSCVVWQGTQDKSKILIIEMLKTRLGAIRYYLSSLYSK